MGIHNLIKFVELTNQYREIERTVLINGSDRQENDVEHSFQLAMCAWYIISTKKLDLDTDLVIKYSLLHDLVEVYAGDTFAYDPDPNAHSTKKDREHHALQKLKENFPEFSEMTALIEEYENRSNPESRFVYALDKVIAPINIYLDGGRIWQLNKISLDQHHEYKKDKVKEHDVVEQLYEELLAILKQDQHILFHKNN